MPSMTGSALEPPLAVTLPRSAPDAPSTSPSIRVPPEVAKESGPPPLVKRPTVRPRAAVVTLPPLLVAVTV